MNQSVQANEDMAAKPHRVLFLHGLFRRRKPHTAKMVADLLKIRLPGAVVVSGGVLELQGGARLPRFVVRPANDQCGWQPVEVIEVTYDDLIADHYTEHSLIRHFAGCIGTIVRSGPRLLYLLTPRVREARIRHRVMAFLFPSVIYLVSSILTVSFVALVTAASDPICKTQTFAPICNGAAAILCWALSYMPECISKLCTPWVLWGLSFLPAIVSAFPWLLKKRRLEGYEDSARSVLAFINIQRTKSTLRSQILNRVNLALESSSEEGRGDVSVVAYSEGSMLLMDALFPPRFADIRLAEEPGVAVKVLVTLGCPLAIVRLLWPKRQARHTRPNVHIGQWFNFYERVDPLGSKLSRLIRKEGIGEAVTEVLDHEFRKPPSRRRFFPFFPIFTHDSYWEAARRMPCPPLQRIADELARQATRNGPAG